MTAPGQRTLSTFTRIALGVVAGFLALHVGWTAFHGHERMVESSADFAASVAERTLALRALHLDLAETHPHLLDTMVSPVYRLHIGTTPPTPPEHLWPHNDKIVGVVAERLALLGYTGEHWSWFAMSRGERSLRFVLPLDAGRFLEVQAQPIATPVGRRRAAAFSTTLMLVGALLLVLFTTRRTTRMLPAFAAAAEAVGVHPDAPALAERRGPRELRRASRAFNEMRRRVHDLLEERGDMLAAMSHDLRTLATRLQLRTDFIADAEQRNRALDDLAAMTTILDEALAYSREEHSDEPRQPLDLVPLCHAIAADERALGHEVTVTGDDSLMLEGQPVALRRAFTNLICNAVDYGGAAHVHTAQSGRVTIRDPGPGLSPEEFDAMTRPYRRGEGSRSRATGGTGLGLAIARRVVERHGGRMSSQRGAEGFAVMVELPALSSSTR